MNKDKRNNIQLLGTLNNTDESGIIANANQIYDANEDKSTQDVSKEHTERIKTLEDKDDAMQTTLENISKIGEASAASNVTYNHSDSKLDATNMQQAIDEVRKRSNYNDGDNIIDFNTIHIITDNQEFAIAAVDINNRILYGIKKDGQPYWGVGVPKVVRDYIAKQVNDNIDVFDISAYHTTGGTLATYDDLEDALGTNGKNIPQSLRKGGMSVKFVQTSDNKYVQYRLMSDTFNTIVANWQGIDDEPIAGSSNLVRSGGVYSEIENKTSNILFYPNDGLYGDIQTISEYTPDTILMNDGTTRTFSGYKLYTIKNDNTANRYLYIEATFNTVSLYYATIGLYRKSDDKCIGVYQYNGKIVLGIHPDYYVKFNSKSEVKTSYSKKDVRDVIATNVSDITENPMTYRPTNTLIGTDESEDGYYRVDGKFIPFANYKSRKYTVESNTNYAITALVSGGPTCLAIAIDSNNSVLAVYNQGVNSVVDTYTDYIITTPPNSAYLLCTGARGNYPIVKNTTLDLISKHYVDKNFESCSEFTIINGTNEEEDGYYEYNTGTFKPFVSYKSTKYRAKGNTNYAITALVSGPTCLAIAVDRDNKVLAYYNQGTNEHIDNYTDYIISTPKNTAYLLCTGARGNYPIVKQVSYNPASKQYVKEEIEKIDFGDELLDYWKGKKGVWFGTSIPAQGYPINVGNLLRMSMINESKGSSMARAGRKAHTPNDPLGDVYGVIGVAWQNICYSLTLSQEEKHDIFLNWTTEQRKANLKLKGYSDEDLVDVKGFSELMAGNFYGEETDESQVTSPSYKPTDIMADNYVQFRKICYADSWNNSTDIEDGFGLIEGRVQPYLSWDNTPDLWILDHGHNDNLGSDSDEDYTTIPEDEYDRWTFLGAMNFLIKKIFDFNPRARIVIIGHYNNSDNKYKRIGEAQKVLADYWNIPIYESWRYLQMPRNRVITTNAYWDKNKIWHNSGFDGTNGYDGWRNEPIKENPRQLEDGTWVHDITLLHAWMVDSLHPGNSDAKEYEARNMASFIRNNVL